MDLKTTLATTPSNSKISLQDNIITFGSCFAQSIGEKLVNNKFHCLVNPLGTLYDPLSVIRWLQYATTSTGPADNSYCEYQGVHSNLEAHSEFSALTKEEVRLKIEGTVQTLGNALQSSSRMIISFGTSFVYRYLPTGNYVANCHKIPAKLFSREILTINALMDSFKTMYESLKQFNPEIKFIVTVSPVRHISDGIPDNNLSKSMLRIFCYELEQLYGDISYYPSYEIMMDDLRDYRFYKSDMIHPTDLAITYIWDQFIKTYFDNPTMEFMKEWHQIQKALQHKPFIPTSKRHQEFLVDTINKMIKLKKWVDVEAEIDQLRSQLIDQK